MQASQSGSWFALYVPGDVRTRRKNTLAKRQTSHANDFFNAKSHAKEKPLLARYPMETLTFIPYGAAYTNLAHI